MRVPPEKAGMRTHVAPESAESLEADPGRRTLVTANGRGRLAAVGVAALLLVLVVLFYRRIALTNLILVDYDLLTYFYPYKEAAASAIREGRLPLWNPYLFTGAPFMANPQTALFYALNLPGYLVPAPLAVKYSIVFHVFLAGVFTYGFARLSLGLGRAGSLVAALTFMFGGFLTQQVGHINQLNAAVWLPLVLLLFDLTWKRSQPLFGLLGGLALSAQVLAGHSQETFLLLAGFGAYAVFRLGQSVIGERQPARQAALWGIGGAALIVAAGIGLAAVQLLPTLELSGESIRGGGLPYREAVTFSLPPWLLARSLLPVFGDSPFSEYIAYSGIIPLFLAAYGLRRRDRLPMALFWLGLAVLAIFLALGGYNPFYELLYKLAPPLRLFRVPARWLYLYAFAIAALAGMGSDHLVGSERVRGWVRSLVPAVLWPALAVVPVWFWQQAALPTKEAAAAEVFWAWAGVILVASLLVHFLPRVGRGPVRAAVLVTFVVAELFAAGSFMNNKNVTAPQADNSLRPTVAQLLQDPGLYRILSISRTDFDAGDKGELKSIFGQTLDDDAVYQLLVAMKHQEALSPNVPMKYSIATLDGYDGGVLPLRRYVNFKPLLLDGVPLRPAASLRPNQGDALLRDQLAGIPDTGLLGLLNVKYIVTDKQGDLWLDNVYYDMSTPVSRNAGSDPAVLRPPAFEATAIGVIYQVVDGQAPAGALAQLTLDDRAGKSFRGTVMAQDSNALPQPGVYRAVLDLNGTFNPREISLRYLGSQGRLVIRGVSLIDRRTGASEPLVLDPDLRRSLSGDLKVYENLRWQPRAFAAGKTTWVKDDPQALDTIRREVIGKTSGEAGMIVLDGVPPAGLGQEEPLRAGGTRGQVNIAQYQPERVLLKAEMAAAGYVVLTDSYFPGWRAYVDGAEEPVVRAEYLFRAVYVPAGSHEVEFRYEPRSFWWGAIISIATLTLMVAGAAGWLRWKRGKSRLTGY